MVRSGGIFHSKFYRHYGALGAKSTGAARGKIRSKRSLSASHTASCLRSARRERIGAEEATRSGAMAIGLSLEAAFQCQRCERPAPQAHGLPSTLQVLGAFYSRPSLLHGSPLRLPISCGYLLTIGRPHSSGAGSECSPLSRHLRCKVATGAGGLPRSGNRPTLKLLEMNQNIRLALQRV
jgi:hypothetical protein